MKKFIGVVFAVFMSLFLFQQSASAHGLNYQTKALGENKIRITLKWSNPKEAQGFIISQYYLNKGKTLHIGYSLKKNAGKSATMDFDLRSALPPVRIVLEQVGNSPKALFKDIKAISAEEYIRHLHDAGILDGTNSGNFKPADKITRGEFATWLVKSLKLSGKGADPKKFKDISKSPAKKYILLAAQAGLIGGYQDKTFRPNDPINVAQVSTIISKAFQFKIVKNGIYVKLTPGKSYSEKVKEMFDTGILTVKDSIYKDFKAEHNINKADCAMMLSRALSTY